MNSSLPDGFLLRRGDIEDLAAVTRILVDEEVAVRGSSEWGEPETRDWLHGLSGDGGELWIAEGDMPAGVLGIFSGETARGWIAVDPVFNGHGIGSSLVRHAETRAAAQGSASLQLGAFAENRAALELLANAGYRDDRHFYRMSIELSAPPAEPQWPEGLTYTTFDPAEARAVHEAVNDAFADDHGHHPLPFEEWRRRRIEAPDFDPTLWFIARDRNAIAGICRCDAKRWGGGWVGALGVRKPWRRRGLGRALLQQSFLEFYDRGERRVGLGVDTQNPSGATRLYERAGMYVVAEDISFEKRLS
jgi:mycothiol synthase